MKSKLAIMFMLFLTITTKAQNFFSKAIYYGASSYTSNIGQTKNPKGYLICYNKSFSLGQINGFGYSQLDSVGNILFSKNYSTGPSGINVLQYAANSMERKDSTYTFFFNNYAGLKISIRIFNTTKMGIINWNRKIEYSNPNYSIDVSGNSNSFFYETNDSGYLVSGIRRHPNTNDPLAPVIIKLDSIGNVLWSKSYNLLYPCARNSFSFAQQNDDILIGFAADSTCNFWGDQLYFSRISSNGNTIWSKQIDNFHGRFSGCIMQDNNYIVLANDSNNFYLMKIDTVGNSIWTKSYSLNIGWITTQSNIASTLDKGFVISSGVDNSGNNDNLLFKTDSLGTLKWIRRYGNLPFEYPEDIKEEQDSSLVLFTCCGTGYPSYYLTKLSNAGVNGTCFFNQDTLYETIINLSLSNISLNEFDSLITSQSLYVNDTILTNPPWVIDNCFTINVESIKDEKLVVFYPNPFHSHTTLKLLNIENSELVISNMLGQQVRKQKIVSKETIINRDRLVNGLYFYQITNGFEIMMKGKLLIE